MSGSSLRRPALRWRDGVPARRVETLAVEEPLEIRVDGVARWVTMRTPGHDLDLALGLMVGEGVITGPDDVRAAEHCPAAAVGPDGEPTHNVVDVTLARRPGPGGPPIAGAVAGPVVGPVAGPVVGPVAGPVVGPDAGPIAAPVAPGAGPRHVSSACGVCGTGSIDDVRTRSPYPLREDPTGVAAGVLAALPDRLRAAQRLFDRTGGVHAAGLFDPAGELLCIREDVGRHNAVDKVVGWAFAAGRLPLRGTVLQVSGRASFELAQKAWTAGCPVLAAVSAPSSLAVAVAEEAGLTLVGFSRGETFTAYAHPERIASTG